MSQTEANPEFTSFSGTKTYPLGIDSYGCEPAHKFAPSGRIRKFTLAGTGGGNAVEMHKACIAHCESFKGCVGYSFAYRGAGSAHCEPSLAAPEVEPSHMSVHISIHMSFAHFCFLCAFPNTHLRRKSKHASFSYA